MSWCGHGVLGVTTFLILVKLIRSPSKIVAWDSFTDTSSLRVVPMYGAMGDSALGDEKERGREGGREGGKRHEYGPQNMYTPTYAWLPSAPCIDHQHWTVA